MTTPVAPRSSGKRRERREAVPVRRLEHELLVRDRRARDDGDRRQRVGVEAHGRQTIAGFYGAGSAGPRMRPASGAATTASERRTTMRRILVAYATKKGSTREVAEAIARASRDAA